MQGEPQRSLTVPRRWFRYRMRTLLAFMALCGVASKFGGQVHAYYAEQHGLEELRRSGGSFYVEKPLDVEWPLTVFL